MKNFSELLDHVLTGENINLHQLIARRAFRQPHYTAYFGERIETNIRFDNNASAGRTLIEIETEDRLGLLHAISQTFAELKLDIAAARIVTERGAALDNFYVREIKAGKIDIAARGPEIEVALRAAIGQLEAFA